MNKTLKTIAWICLALGILGMVVDASALVVGRKLMTERQASFEEMRTAEKSGQSSSEGNFCIAKDADNDGKPDSDCLQLQHPERSGAGQPGFGNRPGKDGMLLRGQNNFDGRRFGVGAILPIFFFALGPVLAVVGAVILLVNREPKASKSKKEKEVKEVKKK